MQTESPGSPKDLTRITRPLLLFLDDENEPPAALEDAFRADPDQRSEKDCGRERTEDKNGWP